MANVENNNLLNCTCLPESEHNHPWLMISHGMNFQKHAFYSISEDRYLKKSIPEMQNKRVSHTSYGWLLLIDIDTLDCCLMNPKTMDKIQLPQALEYGRYICALSKPPTEPDCHILLVHTSLLFCRIGDDKFIQRPLDMYGGHLMTAINFQGKIYAWMLESRGVVTVDFVDEDLVLKGLVNKDGDLCRFPYSHLSPAKSSFFGVHLIESCDELLLVHAIHCPSHWEQVSRYRIFRIDMIEMEWKELRSIGNRAIFLSRYGGMAISLPSSKKTSNIEKDSIYYINAAQCDKNLYVYHIEDRSQTLLLPCRNISGVRSIRSWIMI